MSTFNEDNTIEQMIVSTLGSNGWTYIPAEELPKDTKTMGRNTARADLSKKTPLRKRL